MFLSYELPPMNVSKVPEIRLILGLYLAGSVPNFRRRHLRGCFTDQNWLPVSPFRRRPDGQCGTLKSIAKTVPPRRSTGRLTARGSGEGRVARDLVQEIVTVLFEFLGADTGNGTQFVERSRARIGDLP